MSLIVTFGTGNCETLCAHPFSHFACKKVTDDWERKSNCINVASYLIATRSYIEHHLMAKLVLDYITPKSDSRNQEVESRYD